MPHKQITNDAIATKLDMIHEMLKDHVSRFEKHVEDDNTVADVVNDTATTLRVLKWVVGAGFSIVAALASFK